MRCSSIPKAFYPWHFRSICLDGTVSHERDMRDCGCIFVKCVGISAHLNLWSEFNPIQSSHHLGHLVHIQFNNCLLRQPFYERWLHIMCLFPFELLEPERQCPASEVHPLHRCWTCWADRLGGRPKPTLCSIPVMFSCPPSQRNSNHLNGKFCANRLTWNGKQGIKNTCSMNQKK